MPNKELFTNLLNWFVKLLPTSQKFRDFLDSEYDYSIDKKGSKLSIKVERLQKEGKYD